MFWDYRFCRRFFFIFFFFFIAHATSGARSEAFRIAAIISKAQPRDSIADSSP